MAVDRDYLQAQIALLRDLADAAERAGDTEAAAMYLRLRAQQMDRLREIEERLQPKAKRGNVHSAQPMTGDHAVEMSKSRATMDKKFMGAIRKKGWSLNRLARAVGMSPSSLSQARRKPNDPLFRRIPPDKAKQIEALAGWPATDW